MDTIKGTPFSLTPDEFRTILRAHLEDPHTELQFVIRPSDHLVQLVLELWVNGVETPHNVVLKDDGTWQAKSWVQA